VSGLYGQIQNITFIQYDVLPKLWALTGTWLVRYLPERFSGEISHTIIFFFTFTIISQILSLPLSYYGTFVLEEKFGFNKQTVKLWIADMLKSQALMVVFGTPLLSAFLKIIQITGTRFFYYLWLFGICVQMFAITIYPIFILPLFNKLSPLEPGDLKTGVEGLAKRLNFPLKELYVIDGSKRSAHSNAYFYGLPWKKHIVIYDTLIEKSETEEVVAVLSHELGHWSLSHTTKLFGIAQVWLPITGNACCTDESHQFHMFYIFALFSVFIDNRSLYESFGFYKEHPIIIGFVLFSDALAPMDTVVKLLMNILSRKFEFEAGSSLPFHILLPHRLTCPLDEFAVKLGYQKELAKSLIKLQVQNLSTMDADWLYASYHYSHPILPERLGALGWSTSGKEPAGNRKVVEVDNDKPVKASGKDEL
jgi:STE24 endopeptidase